MGKDAWPGQDTTTVSELANQGAQSSAIVGRLPLKLTGDGRGCHVWRWHGIGRDPAFVSTNAMPLPRPLNLV